MLPPGEWDPSIRIEPPTSLPNQVILMTMLIVMMATYIYEKKKTKRMLRRSFVKPFSSPNEGTSRVVSVGQISNSAPGRAEQCLCLIPRRSWIITKITLTKIKNHFRRNKKSSTLQEKWFGTGRCIIAQSFSFFYFGNQIYLVDNPIGRGPLINQLTVI